MSDKVKPRIGNLVVYDGYYGIVLGLKADTHCNLFLSNGLQAEAEVEQVQVLPLFHTGKMCQSNEAPASFIELLKG